MLVYIVDADTPLLLSRPSMAKIQLVVDIHRRSVTPKMTGITHVCRGTGHFLLPLEGAKSRGDIPVTGGELAPSWSLDMMMVKDWVDHKENFTIDTQTPKPLKECEAHPDGAVAERAQKPKTVKEMMSKTPSTPKSKKELAAYFRLLDVKFNHVGKVRLQKLLNRFYEGIDPTWLKEVVAEFKSDCDKFDGAKGHPVVALPREPAFNDEVAMDLLFIA